MFFEGSEKKLEIVIKKDAPSLRSFDRKHWNKVVESSRATILSEISNDKMDAYLLSESSLFVSDRRAMMITCGTTTLVHAVSAMLKFIHKDDIELLIYERKREIFPEYQRSNFYQDAKILNENFDGKAFRFGDEDDHHILLYRYENGFQPTEEDMTLEVLMHGLERSAAQVFECGSRHNEESIIRSGVRELLPGYQVDDFIFEPQGYSLNAIKEDKYFTIHVTPQQFGSYVSFETNHVFSDDMEKCVRRVFEVFKPSTCNLFFFQKEGLNQDVNCDFRLKKKVKHKISGFDVHFNHYYKPQESASSAVELEIE